MRVNTVINIFWMFNDVLSAIDINDSKPYILTHLDLFRHYFGYNGYPENEVLLNLIMDRINNYIKKINGTEVSNLDEQSSTVSV